MQAFSEGAAESMAYIKSLMRMTDGEYRAHLNGINTFFGAVLGFVISGIEMLDPIRFGLVLGLISSIVISILYINTSRHRVVYSVTTLLMVAGLPFLTAPLAGEGFTLPPKLQPTLIVWTLITIFAEFFPREKVAAEAAV